MKNLSSRESKRFYEGNALLQALKANKELSAPEIRSAQGGSGDAVYVFRLATGTEISCCFKLYKSELTAGETVTGIVLELEGIRYLVTNDMHKIDRDYTIVKSEERKVFEAANPEVAKLKGGYVNWMKVWANQEEHTRLLALVGAKSVSVDELSF